jgi:hypothetical protein
MTKLDVAHRDMDLEFNFDSSVETEKIKCVKSLRALLSNLMWWLVSTIENYKYIVDIQDGLIQKSVLKQGHIKNPEEFNVTGSRFKVLDDREYNTTPRSSKILD